VLRYENCYGMGITPHIQGITNTQS
jgi:hypothetical protein